MARSPRRAKMGAATSARQGAACNGVLASPSGALAPSSNLHMSSPPSMRSSFLGAFQRGWRGC
eukprot:683021-Pyramimonas_sp.AAC.1